MSDLRVSLEKGILCTIVLAYVVLGVLFAVLTPPWQVPDEPAHYNYVRYLVEERRLPVLRVGDYDQEYISKATSQRFAPELAIEPIRYQFHQPPLFYLLAAPVYVAFGGSLVPLRLLSVLLGAGLLAVAFMVGKVVCPNRSWPALGTAAFIAFIPQHVAMTAGVENDALAELLVGLVLLGLVRWLASDETVPRRRLVTASIWVGLGLLTKTTAYIGLPLAMLAWLLKVLINRRPGPGHLNARQAGVALLLLLVPALLLGLPLFSRNAVVYGDLDITALRRHDEVVVGQLRTRDWVAEHGWANLPAAFLTTAFHSFWAQFGWMAVPIDGRIYQVLRLLCILVSLGFVWWLIDRKVTEKRPMAISLLLACSALCTLAGFLGYNLTLYQPQGRYLFPALIPLGLAWSYGLYRLVQRRDVWMVGAVLALIAVWGLVRSLLGRCGDRWQVLITGAAAIGLGARAALPDRVGRWLFVAPYLLLAVLCAVSPFWFIVPYLAP